MLAVSIVNKKRAVHATSEVTEAKLGRLILQLYKD